jgi:dynein heavy chain
VILNEKTDFNTAKIIINQSDFIQRIKTQNKSHIDEKILKKLKLIILKPEFDPEMIAQKNYSCKFLA